MKRTKLLALLALLAMLVAACGGGETDEATTTTGDGDGATTTTDDSTDTTDDSTDTTTPPTGGNAGEGGNLLLLQWQAPSQANAYLSTGTKDLLASSIVLEPLAEVAPDTSLVPALAEEIPSKDAGTIAEDDTSITWTLKEGLLWSDGTPVTADDVVFTYEYCSDEATGCTQDYVTTVASVEAIDDRTVTVNFNSPQPYPFTVFVTYQQPILQRAQMQDCVGAAAVSCTDQNFSPVGTGPYMVSELRPEDTVLYEMNPNYRGIENGQPFFGSLEIKGGGDAEASARSVLEIGEADYAWNLQVAPEIIEPMQAAGNGEVKVAFTSNVEHINLNQTDPDADPPSDISNPHPILFQNSDLARALSMAINRDELVAVGYGPSGVPTCTLWPVPGEVSTNQDWCLTHDMAGAQALLDEAGYVDTDGDGVRETPDGVPLEFDYLTSTNAVRQSNQDLIATYWNELGIAVNMGNEDAGLFFDGTCASDACIWKFFTDIQMYTNGNPLPDGQGYMQSYLTSEIPTAANNYAASGNIPRYENPEYDEVWNQLAATPLDDPARIDLLIQLQDFLVEDGIIIPLIYRGNVSAFGNDIQGVGDLNGWDSEYWNIEEWTRSS